MLGGGNGNFQSGTFSIFFTNLNIWRLPSEAWVLSLPCPCRSKTYWKTRLVVRVHFPAVAPTVARLCSPLWATSPQPRTFFWLTRISWVWVSSVILPSSLRSSQFKVCSFCLVQKPLTGRLEKHPEVEIFTSVFKTQPPPGSAPTSLVSWVWNDLTLLRLIFYISSDT